MNRFRDAVSCSYWLLESLKRRERLGTVEKDLKLSANMFQASASLPADKFRVSISHLTDGVIRTR
jgi:hypothetical protein